MACGFDQTSQPSRSCQSFLSDSEHCVSIFPVSSIKVNVICFSFGRKSRNRKPGIVDSKSPSIFVKSWSFVYLQPNLSNQERPLSGAAEIQLFHVWLEIRCCFGHKIFYFQKYLPLNYSPILFKIICKRNPISNSFVIAVTLPCKQLFCRKGTIDLL